MNHTEPNVDKGPDNINFRLRKSAAPLILAISTLCLLLSAALTSFAAATTTISGIVKTSAGQPVRGSVTLHDISTPRVSGQTPLDRQFASKSDGTFSIPEVPAGKYQICLGAPQMNLLDPCIWSAAPQVADTSKGTNVSGLTIVADTGTLQVHVNDPDSMLPAPKGGSAGQTLSVTTTARSGRQVRFLLLKTTASAWDYCLPVPYDQTMTLDVKSSGVSLSDGNNQKYAANALSIPVRIPSGGSWPTIAVNVGSPER